MRRIAALLVGLVLVAGTVEAQAVKCTQSKTTRLKDKGAQFVNGVMKSWYVSSDSVATTCSGFPAARVDTVTVPGPVVHDTVYGPKPDSVKPPVDTVKPPPVDTTPPSGQAKLFDGTWSALPADGQTVGAWKRWGGQGSLALVDAAGLGFPAGLAKVLRVAMGTGDFDWVEVSGKWSLPAIGQSRAYRLYYRNATTTTGNSWASTHPVESTGLDGGIGGNFYAWHIGSGGQWAFSPEGAGFPRNHFTINPTATDLGTLAKNVTYRVEWKWTRTGSNVYSLDLRIYDGAGKLAYDKDTIRAWGNSTPTLASNPGGIALDDGAVTGFRVGINGGFSATGAQYVYWGGFAVCTDWCGAY